MEVQKKGKNKDKLRYMKLLKEQIVKYKYEKYVKDPSLFCHIYGGMLKMLLCQIIIKIVTRYLF